jgi:hypothetical protein
MRPRKRSTIRRFWVISGGGPSGFDAKGSKRLAELLPAAFPSLQAAKEPVEDLLAVVDPDLRDLQQTGFGPSLEEGSPRSCWASSGERPGGLCDRWARRGNGLGSSCHL